MKVLKYLTIIVLFSLLWISTGYSLSADDILQKMDEHHLISGSFAMTIRAESYINNQFENSTVMKGYINNGKMILLTFLEPEKMKGRKIIIKGNDMWLIIPNVKNPIRITTTQRLMGGISYSDVIGLNYTQDYNAKLNGEESMAGMNSNGNKSDANNCFILELAAKEKGTRYDKIIIWVAEQNFLPVKADFFALSGKKMATAYYTAPQEWEGQIIVTKTFLFDQINTAKYYSLEYSDIKAINLTDSLENLQP